MTAKGLTITHTHPALVYLHGNTLRGDNNHVQADAGNDKTPQ